MKPTPLQLKMRGLHERIEANFEDAAAWMVYGDALLEKGDPRGELITSWHTKRDFAGVLERRTAAVFGDAANDIGPDGPFELGWYMGTVESLTLRMPADAAEAPRPYQKNRRREALFARLRGLLKLPVCQWLRSYTVEFDSAPGFTTGLLEPLVHPARIRSFCVEATTGPERYGMQLEVGPNFELGVLANLERLALTGRFTTMRTKLQALVHPTVKILELTDDNFFEPDFRALAASRLPMLERLVLMPTSKHSHSAADVLDDLFASTGLPALRHLEIKYCGFADDILAALEQSPMLARLTSLELTGSSFDPARLAQPAFAHLAAA